MRLEGILDECKKSFHSGLISVIRLGTPVSFELFWHTLMMKELTKNDINEINVFCSDDGFHLKQHQYKVPEKSHLYQVPKSSTTVLAEKENSSWAIPKQ